MHLMIPYASALSEAGQHAASTLALPNLERWLARLTLADTDTADEHSRSPPHERALGRALGLQGDDGTLPWAAHLAAQDGIVTGDTAWGLLTPAHWRVGTDHVSLVDPAALDLDEAESRALLATLQPLFVDEGWTLAYGAPLRWYAGHDSLQGLPCASADRAIGRDVDTWLAADPRLRFVRRLQAEVQMQLYREPVNEAREARGALAVNSFWLSGCGRHQTATTPGDLVYDDRLRAPALNEDWAAWTDAWRALDAGPIAAALQLARPGAAQLTLCGERAAQRYEQRPGSFWSRLTSGLRSPSLQPILAAL